MDWSLLYTFKNDNLLESFIFSLDVCFLILLLVVYLLPSLIDVIYYWHLTIGSDMVLLSHSPTLSLLNILIVSKLMNYWEHMKVYAFSASDLIYKIFLPLPSPEVVKMIYRNITCLTLTLRKLSQIVNKMVNYIVQSEYL